MTKGRHANLTKEKIEKSLRQIEAEICRSRKRQLWLLRIKVDESVGWNGHGLLFLELTFMGIFDGELDWTWDGISLIADGSF